MQSDAMLLRRYAQDNDPESFTEIVRRHAGLVFGTSYRITRNADDAEDISQECFMELACRAGTITASLVAWLHAAAKNRSIDAIRNASRRRLREEEAVQRNGGQEDASWEEIERQVDAALDGLPEEMREAILLHYFEGMGQAEIAARFGVSQPTVSRRLDKGVEALRSALKKAGVAATVAALTAHLAQSAAATAPASLSAALCKIGLAGVGASAAATTSAAASSVAAAASASSGGIPPASGVWAWVLGTAKAKIIVAVAIGLAIVGAVATYQRGKAGNPVWNPARGSLKREGGKVWIEPVGRLRFGAGRDNQLIAALQVALRAMGENVTYDDLMGFSGAAFRLQCYLPELCPSSVDLLLTFNHAEPALWAYGYATELALTAPIPRPQMVRFREAAIKSIDEGRPVIADNLRGDDGSYGVIAGYQNSEKHFLCRTYYDRTDDLVPSKGFPMQVCVIGKKGTVPNPKDVVRKSLEIAIDLAHTSRTDWNGRPQASGFSAFQRWHDELADDAAFAKADRGTIYGYYGDGNAWMYVALLDARKAAVRYLRAHAQDLGEKAAVHLLNAADVYQKIVVELQDGQRHVPLPEKLTGKPIDNWTPEMRRSQAASLLRVLELEKKAVSALEMAVAP